MANTLQNDFTSGIISKRLLGKYNSAPYQCGCLKLRNFIIMPQGGVTRRPGTLLLNRPNHTQGTTVDGEKIALPGKRIIPFCLKTTENYIIELGNGTLRIWKQDGASLMRFTYSGTQYTCLTETQVGFGLYTEAELDDIQYAQDYQRLFLAHRNHKPMVITYSEVESGGTLVPSFAFSQLTPTLQTGDTDNTGLFTGNDCPGVVFYYASRLWFASSKNHPFRMWASRPTTKYQYYNYEMFDNVSVVDDVETAKIVQNATLYGTISITANVTGLNPTVDETTFTSQITTTGEYEFIYNGTSWTLNETAVTLSSYGIAISSSATPVSGNKLTVRYYNLTEQVTTTKKVYTQDNAMLLEVGSTRNDEIKWISAIGNYIMVGTASGEWIMPGSINALEASIYQSSAFGSDNIQCIQAGNDLIFMQTGKRRVRGYVSSQGSFSALDLTFYSGEFGEIKHMAWQRVPEPRLYCVMEDGRLMVLNYDRNYSLQGWCEWTFDGTTYDSEHTSGASSTGLVKDVCITETENGQKVFIVIERTIGSTTRRNLESFEEKDIMDTGKRWDCYDSLAQPTYHTVVGCEFVTNSYERTSSSDGTSVGRKKRIYRVVARVLNTESITIGYRYDFAEGTIDSKYYETRTPNMENMSMDDVEVSVPGGFEKYVAVTVKEDTDKPITVTALSLLTEVE